VEACPFNTDSFFERTLFILHKNEVVWNIPTKNGQK
jgi:hypothetical protein